MIRTIVHKQYWKIIKLFYDNHNNLLHLREISRKIGIKESSTSLHLNSLENANILKSEREANLKKYFLKKQVIPQLFSLFDTEKLENLPLLRKNAVKEYLKSLPNKPLLLIVFGSTAKGTFTEKSDIDILQISNSKKNIKEAKNNAEAITGQELQIFHISETKLYKELKMKQDQVLQVAITTGFAVFNKEYFYELIYNEGILLKKTSAFKRRIAKKD